ncbi:H/ACA ribonucleoprotein complex subunit GAR1 [Haloquadratum walsbyi]|jgi:RNA-binding protein|uniref:tRNA/rRNA pseudouridine synthase complex protein Gar1 n=1 Tax=Haloquadratum walsbyi (strain DSM 16790 / HBSQ001) TaxID=362976 RepID=Q18K20_HALWD|nr:Gar1/Naf1 family protein [Haloquadratum walsbyi]CAJ51632.1 tRNA/rRNA pseudouridine synthase complex protein Gar1 [Haloquadratum walsbyi DSM 16790]
MQRLGIVTQHVQHLLIARCDSNMKSPPSIGAHAIDESLSTVGRVVDVFGPTSQPYIAITPVETCSPAAILGEKIYAK